MDEAPAIPVVPQQRHCWRYKVCHASFDGALAHAKHVRWLDGQRGHEASSRCVVIFWCTLHSSWHVGHQRVRVAPAQERGPARNVLTPGDLHDDCITVRRRLFDQRG